MHKTGQWVALASLDKRGLVPVHTSAACRGLNGQKAMQLDRIPRKSHIKFRPCVICNPP